MLGQQYQFDSYRLISQTLLSDIGQPGAHAVFAILDFLRRPRSQNGSVFQEPRCVGRPEEVRFEEHSICFQKMVFGSGNALEPQFGVGNRRHWLSFCWLHIETSFSYRKEFPFRAKFPDSTILLVIGNSSEAVSGMLEVARLHRTFWTWWSELLRRDLNQGIFRRHWETKKKRRRLCPLIQINQSTICFCEDNKLSWHRIADDEEKNVSVSWFHSDAVSWPYRKFWKLVVHGGDRTDAIVVAQKSSYTVTALFGRNEVDVNWKKATSTWWMN